MKERNKIDDILTGITPSETDEKEVKPTEAGEISQDDQEVQEEPEVRENEPKPEEAEEETGSKSLDKVEEKESNPDIETDEYGNEVTKSRMYSETEVQEMIRERLKRGNHGVQQQAQVQQAAQGFEADPNSDVPWENQLEDFVKHTIDKVQRESQTREYQREEQDRQANFESKFTTGMVRYKDFKETVGKMPITDSMMLATRDMKDPAAFIYAAVKMQPEEVKRIAALRDPFQQAAEIGRLEEKMKKARNISKTARPLEPTKGDMSSRVAPKQSIEDKINKYARNKLKR